MLGLNETPRIQVSSGGIPLLHILNGHLLCKTGVQGSLSLLLIELLGLRHVEEVELFDLAVGGRRSVELGVL
jgi:hypothetical protein